MTFIAMKRLLLTTIAACLLATAAHAEAKTFDEMESEASNHGYNTAALVTCGDKLIVTNPKLRIKLDRMYRDNKRWEKAYREGFESGSPPDGPGAYKVIARNRLTVCLIAGESEAGWLKLTPAGRQSLIDDDRRETERNNKQ